MSEPDRSPVWSSDGRYLAFIRENDTRNDIWIFDFSTQDLWNLSDSQAEDGVPVWSPQGHQLAWATEERLQIVDLDTHTTQLFSDPDVDMAYPFWSPDGERIAFVIREGENSELYMLTLSTGQTTRLTDRPNYDDGSPVWSPDGQRIAFLSRDIRENNWGLLVVEAATGEIHVVREFGTHRRPHPALDFR